MSSQFENLNSLQPENRDGVEYCRTKAASSNDGNIHVFFDDLEQKLITHIRLADMVVGCVAWLTNERILLALAEKRFVSIIVQKEDFLRPDGTSDKNWTTHLRSLYGRLKFDAMRLELPGLAARLSTLSIDDMASIRCVGNYNSDKKPAFPRSHHKFVIFCSATKNRSDSAAWGQGAQFQPYGVWTGSFNFTENATKSFENAVLIREQSIVDAFYDEYCHILSLSEPLDWETDWVAPEYRIGT